MHDALIALDVRHGRSSSAWGSAVYTRELARALGDRVRPLAGPSGVPDVLWEQVLLPARLRARRFALVHAPHCFLPLRRPCPGVVTVHDLAFEERPEDFTPRMRAKFRTLVPRAARSAERVICVSEFTRADVCRRYGVDPRRTRVVHLAPALPHGELPVPAGPYLLAVGALHPKKNLRRLVRVHARLRAEGLPHRLILAGPDEGEGPALAGHTHVELTGQLGDARLDALMRGADALVHPSLYEGFGLAPVEAMARGVPVAVAACTALPEATAGAAALFDPREESDIVRAVRELLSDREGWAARGRARVAALSWAATAAATAAVYRELL